MCPAGGAATSPPPPPPGDTSPPGDTWRCIPPLGGATDAAAVLAGAAGAACGGGVVRGTSSRPSMAFSTSARRVSSRFRLVITRLRRPRTKVALGGPGAAPALPGVVSGDVSATPPRAFWAWIAAALASLPSFCCMLHLAWWVGDGDMSEPA